MKKLISKVKHSSTGRIDGVKLRGSVADTSGPVSAKKLLSKARDDSTGRNHGVKLGDSFAESRNGSAVNRVKIIIQRLLLMIPHTLSSS